MVIIEEYCKKLQEALLMEFGGRVCYIGLQGSYLRGEVTEHSDIDIMFVLDTLDIKDMDTYRSILEKVGNENEAYGFICSREDLRNWNPMEICQLLYTTKNLYGTLQDYVPKWTVEDEENYIKMSLNNLYHGICHSYIHAAKEKVETKFLSFYKSAFFILKNTQFLKNYRRNENTAVFILKKAELVKELEGEDKAVMERLLYLTDGGNSDIGIDLPLLFHWCQHKMVDFI